VFLGWVVVSALMFAYADRVAGVLQSLDRGLSGWIWGAREPFGENGRRVLFRWGLRVWAVASLTLCATMIVLWL
jgi:hypothetical protein